MMALGLFASGCLVVASGVIGERVVNRQGLPGKITVTYWEKWTGAEGSEMMKIVNDFNASQDKIHVNYLSISGVDVKTMLAAAGGDPPDVAGLWDNNLTMFSDAGALIDLKDMARKAGLTEDYYIPGYYKSYVYRGGLWGLPSTPASIALHVRTDLMPPGANTPETFPKTLEGMDALAERVTKRAENGSLIRAGFLPSNPGWWNWAWAYLWGGQLFDGDKVTVNCPQNVEAFKWIKSYTDKFGSRQVQSFRGGFGNFSSPEDPFMDGKVAMEMNGTWKGGYINVNKPDTPWFAVPFPYPAKHPELAGRTILSQDVLCIPRGAKHPEAAFEFIKYVQRQDVMEKLCAGHGKNSPLMKVSEAFFAHHQNKYIRLFDRIARSPGAFGPPMNGCFPQVSAEVANAFQEVQGGADAKQALDRAQARCEVIWATYQKQVLNR